MLLPSASILARAQTGRTAIVAVMVVMRMVEDGGHLCGSAYLKWMLICKPQLRLRVQGRESRLQIPAAWRKRTPAQR